MNYHPYKISTHQLLAEKTEKPRKVSYTHIFDARILKPKSIVFDDEAHFYNNSYVNKQNYRYWGSKNPYLSEVKSLHLVKVAVYAGLSSTGIFWIFIGSPTITGYVSANLLRTEFFPWARRINVIKNFHFMQNRATPHRTMSLLLSEILRHSCY